MLENRLTGNWQLLSLSLIYCKSLLYLGVPFTESVDGVGVEGLSAGLQGSPRSFALHSSG